MICPQCYDASGESVPMDVKPKSAVGMIQPTLYLTEEIKICPECGLQVRETYRAEWVLPQVQLENKKELLP